MAAGVLRGLILVGGLQDWDRLGEKAVELLDQRLACLAKSERSGAFLPWSATRMVNLLPHPPSAPQPQLSTLTPLASPPPPPSRSPQRDHTGRAAHRPQKRQAVTTRPTGPRGSVALRAHTAAHHRTRAPAYPTQRFAHAVQRQVVGVVPERVLQSKGEVIGTATQPEPSALQPSSSHRHRNPTRRPRRDTHLIGLSAAYTSTPGVRHSMWACGTELRWVRPRRRSLSQSRRSRSDGAYLHAGSSSRSAAVWLMPKKASASSTEPPTVRPMMFQYSVKSRKAVASASGAEYT